ncbi:hypothetical protein DAETH_08120 [Deinococcus aetherius]|uniref:Uncharacterized protein n=1 Tax=Deinococcus aetherius TaxID=200252 RepID=A0ABM8AB72_9DEIO|nr:DUF5367 domain-containing protein [Deinococcus aetherius]BDP40843.1 hypothetical protein DAETH_08120 [Deinococcus aetherius]
MTTATVSPSRPALRLPLLVALGVALWFLAAMMFRVLGPFVLVPGNAALPLVFALFIPVAWAFLRVGVTLGGAGGSAILPAAVVMSLTAMLLDSLALTFFPAIYGLPPAQLFLVATSLLWGVAWILLIAFVQARRAG